MLDLEQQRCSYTREYHHGKKKEMITIYSKDYCPYCDGAKAYLTKVGIEHEVIDVTNDQDLKLWLKDQGHNTVPQIYYKGQLFVEGGYTGLSTMLPNDIEERKRVITESI